MSMFDAPVDTVPTRPVFQTLTATSLVLLGVALIWSLADPRSLDGVGVWVKPAKFALSFVIHFGTMALIVSALSARAQKSWPIRIAASLMAIAFLSEMGYLFFQAAQAQHSHFNLSTPFHQMAYQLMGVGAVLLVGLPVLVAWVARRDALTGVGPATRQGIWTGAILSCALTLLVAGYMSSSPGHFVGTPVVGAGTLPIVGWSTEVGDLRPAHFLSLHALQALPLLGLWLDKTGRGGRWMMPAAVVWTGLTLAVFVQALMGLPLIAI